MTDRKPIFVAFRDFMGGLPPLGIKQFAGVDDRLLIEPAALPSVGQRGVGNTGRLSQFMDRKNPPLVGDFDRISPVGPLRYFICPSAIPGAVVRIGIYAIQRVRGTGPRPHVLIKRIKIFQPSSANPDASTSVIRELLKVRVVAARLHVNPDSVFRSFSVGLSQIVLRPFGSKATATIGSSPAQIAAEGNGARSTIAHAQPSRMAALVRRPGHNLQAPEALAREINSHNQSSSVFDD